MQDEQHPFTVGMWFSLGHSTVVFGLVLGLVLALLLNRPLRGRGFVRTILFAPYVTTLSAAAMLLHGCAVVTVPGFDYVDTKGRTSVTLGEYAPADANNDVSVDGFSRRGGSR